MFGVTGHLLRRNMCPTGCFYVDQTIFKHNERRSIEYVSIRIYREDICSIWQYTHLQYTATILEGNHTFK